MATKKKPAAKKPTKAQVEAAKAKAHNASGAVQAGLAAPVPVVESGPLTDTDGVIAGLLPEGAGQINPALAPTEPQVPVLALDVHEQETAAVPLTVAERLDSYSGGLGLLATERAKANFENWDEFPGEVQDGIVTWAAIGLLVEVNAKQGELTVKAREELTVMDEQLGQVKDLAKGRGKFAEKQSALVLAQAKEIVRLGGDAEVGGDDTLHGKVDNLKH